MPFFGHLGVQKKPQITLGDARRLIEAQSKAPEWRKRFQVPRKWPEECIMCWGKAKVGVGCCACQGMVGSTENDLKS